MAEVLITSFTIPQIQPSKLQPTKKKRMSLKNTTTAASSSSSSSSFDNSKTRKLPILLFDVMDTIVRDPFYHHVPAFFGMSMKELLECKHPTAWIEFEKGLINEEVNFCVVAEWIQIKCGEHQDLQQAQNFFQSPHSF